MKRIVRFVCPVWVMVMDLPCGRDGFDVAECPYFDLDRLGDRDDLPGEVRCGRRCQRVCGPRGRR